jgi:hypothetical protein
MFVTSLDIRQKTFCYPYYSVVASGMVWHRVFLSEYYLFVPKSECYLPIAGGGIFSFRSLNTTYLPIVGGISFRRGAGDIFTSASLNTTCLYWGWGHIYVSQSEYYLPLSKRQGQTAV